MRRVAILALLYGAVQLILPLESGAQGPRAQALLVFGFLILSAYTSGELAKAVSLPKITGYLVAGMIFGPSALGVVSGGVAAELGPVSRLAIAMIAFLAGAELRWNELKERGRAVLTMLGLELTLSFAFILSALLALQGFVPFFRPGAPLTELLALGALFAAVAIVHSPAVTMALLTETGARGPVARTTLGIVLVADVVVVLLFSGALTATQVLVPSAGTVSGFSAGAVAWEIGGSLLVGAALGGVVALYLRFVQRELMMFAVVVVFFGAEIARLAHVETLLTLLVAGFITENATREGGRELLHAMERSAAPVFVVFFALAGASIHVEELLSIWPLALAIVAARAAGIFGGTTLGARLARVGPERRYVWLGLVSQAGVAIGLATILVEAYPERGQQMRTLMLSVITINEIAGQILFRIALARSGEIVAETGEAEPAVPRGAVALEERSA